MQIITGGPHNQIVFTHLEEGVSSAHSGCFVASFVENIDLNAFGFELRTLKVEFFLFLKVIWKKREGLGKGYVY